MSASDPLGCSVAVFSDFTYRVEDGKLSAELPFSLFLVALRQRVGRLVLTGRLDPREGSLPYPIESIEFAPLPYYASGSDLRKVLAALPVGMRRFWRLLDHIDVAWVLGPHPPQSVVFAALALARRRSVVLGVRQNLPELIRHRHPRRPVIWLAAWLLELGFRLLARRVGVVVVGPELARIYRRSRAVAPLYVSLLDATDVRSDDAPEADYDAQELRLLTVGRLDPEKNPMLQLDVLEHALATDPRWHLHVCGDGPLEQPMRRRADQRGLADRVTFHGHVAFGPPLWEHYRRAHVLLHVSRTEGAPQVLLEAFAARLPVVATAVGGVGEMIADRGLPIPPDDPRAAAKALQRMLDDPRGRRRRTDAASAFVRQHTMQAETERLAQFLADPH